MSIESIEKKIDKISDDLTVIKIEIGKNSIDLYHHIKRTDILQSNQQKIIYLLLVGTGIMLAMYGPQFIEILKVLK